MNSTKKSPWSSTPPTAERIVSAIERIGNVLRTGAWQFATAEGLNPAQVDILAILLSRSEGVRLSWLAQQMGVTTASASDSVAALVSKNLVEKAKAADDGRAIALRLTTEGKALATKINEGMSFAFDAVEALPKSQQDAMYAGLLAVIGQLQKSERFPEIRTCVTCRYFAPHTAKDKEGMHHCRLLNAPLPTAMVRLDCAEHEAVEPHSASLNWKALQRM